VLILLGKDLFVLVLPSKDLFVLVLLGKDSSLGSRDILCEDREY
jgi:hypothetical protein